MTRESKQVFEVPEATAVKQEAAQEAEAMVAEMIQKGTFLGSVWYNGDSFAESTEITSPYAYSVSSGWRTVKYNKWYTRDNAPKGPRDHTDVDEMILAIFISSVDDGFLKLHQEGMPGTDKFSISNL